MIDKSDILNESDIKTLVDRFYGKVLSDPIIGFIFTDIAAISFEKHMPIMYAFWGSILLGTRNYSGNPMWKHIELDRKTDLKKEHFDQWLKLWEETVNENFMGSNAEEAITRAKHIAGLMQHKIQQAQALKNN